MREETTFTICSSTHPRRQQTYVPAGTSQVTNMATNCKP